MIIVADGSELVLRLEEFIVSAANTTIAKKGAFNLALSGGSLVALLAQSKLAKCLDSDYSRWNIFLADERCVPVSDAESTFGEYCRKMKQFVQETTFPEPFSQGDAGASAREYEALLRRAGVMDLVILGLGPDGHTASLFPPVTPEMLTTENWVEPVYNSPKPPSTRLTMTIPYISQAGLISFVATGSNKIPALKRTSYDRTLPPAVLPKDRVYWFLDGMSASGIQ
ncbi:hypothetical protein PSACC_02482 [Paramicrosporidium saccamoebae]|uniref:6-phosphogluconolactonase n=1 Tax=Paramicrosporidium saccamoebae TaxID=1246581 RepID=A0A2H9TIX0_9FUNG|nr:hypothetical protein PSACC_02482 [Paramicrosporidium saccamoebae]